MDWLRKQSPLCDNYPLGKLSKKTGTPFRERMPAFLPSFVLQRCKDTEKFKIFKSLSLYIRNVTHISQYSQNHRWTCQISWWLVLLEHGCREISVRIILLPLHHYRKLWSGEKPWVSSEPLPSWHSVAGRNFGARSWLCPIQNVFAEQNASCGYVWFCLKRLFGTKFTNRRKTHGFIRKNHVVW